MKSLTQRMKVWSVTLFLVGTISFFTVATQLLSADDAANKRALRQSFAEKVRKRQADRNKAKAKGTDKSELPKNLEYAKAKKTPGRTNLPRINDKALGRPMTSLQLDELLAEDVGLDIHALPGQSISDEQFIRRIFLDVVGRLPSPADIAEYTDDKTSGKKERLIDRLLSLPQYGQNWANYWRDVVAYRSTAGERPAGFGEADWLEQKFNANQSWADIVSDMLTAKGLSPENPQSFFLGMHMGQTEELAGETARIFMGLQIACAQCHDHPSDVWKRDQFHEFASFLGKAVVRQRPDLKDKFSTPFVVEIADAPPRKQYRKPDLKDPTKPGEMVAPVFLTGQPLAEDTNDTTRRHALAKFITSKTNPYFARAFVNRIWCELLGQGFISPVDDLALDKEAAYPKAFDALSRSFAASNYDIKQLFRTILNSQAYDRKFMEKGVTDEIEKVTVTPTRLSSDQLFDSLDWILGNIDDGRQSTRRAFGSRGLFKSAFGFDPSLDRTEIEGSIPQALALMNSMTINERIDCDKRGSLLNKLFAAHKDDGEIVNMLYLRVLARKPNADELAKCLSYVKQATDRTDGFEDVLWALLNCTEFLHNH